MSPIFGRRSDKKCAISHGNKEKAAFLKK